MFLFFIVCSLCFLLVWLLFLNHGIKLYIGNNSRYNPERRVCRWDSRFQHLLLSWQLGKNCITIIYGTSGEPWSYSSSLISMRTSWGKNGRGEKCVRKKWRASAPHAGFIYNFPSIFRDALFIDKTPVINLLCRTKMAVTVDQMVV